MTLSGFNPLNPSTGEFWKIVICCFFRFDFSDLSTLIFLKIFLCWFLFCFNRLRFQPPCPPQYIYKCGNHSGQSHLHRVIQWRQPIPRPPTISHWQRFMRSNHIQTGQWTQQLVSLGRTSAWPRPYSTMYCLPGENWWESEHRGPPGNPARLRLRWTVSPSSAAVPCARWGGYSVLTAVLWKTHKQLARSSGCVFQPAPVPRSCCWSC